MFELGFALPERARFQRRVDTVVHTLARRMRGVALFLLRSGPEYVCTTRAGSLPLTGLMVYEGTRRPLFTSVGGVAILQTLAPPEMHAILEDNVAQEIARRGSGRLQALQAMRERSQQYGFGVNLGDVVPGIHAFATPVLDARGQAFAALCLTGTSEQYGQERVPALHQELAAASHTLQEDALKFNM
jgi:DNA-binding IclR family transcriptional regulator